MSKSNNLPISAILAIIVGISVLAFPRILTVAVGLFLIIWGILSILEKQK